MYKERYSHNDVTKICELPPRRVVHWTQVGLVEAETEASGAGSKREYNYTNLLEFGLCKELFDMGIGIQSVKKILKDLREQGDLKAWAEEYESYFKKIGQEIEQWFKKQGGVACPPDLTGKNPFLWLNPNHLKNYIRPDRPVGILFYCFKRNERIQVVVPLPLREAIEAIHSYKDIFSSIKMIIVDLGKIKISIEHKLLLM